MKKLLVFLSAVVIGASITQAASVNWKVDVGGHKDETVYIYNGDLTSAITSWQDGATISADDTSAITTALGGYRATGTMSNRSGSGSLEDGSISSTLTAIIYNSVEDGATFYWTTISTSGFVYTPPDPPPSGNATSSSLTTGTFSFASGTPPTPPIPEPTTVALLALGLAALGLKRKVA